MPQPDIRSTILEVIAERTPKGKPDGSLQSGSVLGLVHERLGGARDPALEEAILTAFHDLFRTGYLAWGLNLANPNPPFFHITDQGRRALANVSRDPGNPDGYFQVISKIGPLNPISESYLKEAVSCYAQDLPKSSAVMVGGASESLVLELRDRICSRLQELRKPIPKELNDWRIKVVLDAIHAFLESNSGQIDRGLRDSVQSYWPAFVQQIRVTRNEVGHPTSVDPVTVDTIHASLLIFPELLKVQKQLLDWVTNVYK